MNTRICIVCKKEKSVDDFNKGKYKVDSRIAIDKQKYIYTQNRCRDCGKKLFKAWYEKKKQSVEWMKSQSEKTKKWYRSNTERASQANKDRRKKLRTFVLNQYGNRCACCGETTYEFLGIDHVKNNGAAHRKIIYKGIYEWLVKNNFPKEDFQVLCQNCNLAKALYKICPHQKNSQ